MKTISLIEIEMIFKLIIKKLRDEGYEEIEIENDFYKQVPSDNWYLFENDNIEYGSLFDDIEELKKLPISNFCTYVDFDRIASLLKAISQNNNPI